MPVERNMCLDIPEENLHCHHFLFIKDVITSTFDSSRDCFKTKFTSLSYRRARLNGIVVAQESLLDRSERHFWLDDGTSVIRAIFSQEVLKRRDGYAIDLSTLLSVFGKIVLYQNKEIAIRCGGFKIEDDCLAEIYHWIKILQDRPKEGALSQTEQSNMFYSLSSLPSPKRLLTPNFMESPLRATPSSQNPKSYLWSPDHVFATSTPIRAVQDLTQRRHPIAVADTVQEQQRQQQCSEDEFDEFDEFDSFGDVDLLALEKNAIQQASASTKRKWELSME